MFRFNEASSGPAVACGSLCLLVVVASAFGQCVDDEFSLEFNGVKVFVISRLNNTCICPAGYSASSFSVSGSLTAATFTVGGQLASDLSITASSASVTAAVSAVNVSSLGVISAASFVGDASSLTNLSGQAEFAAVRNTLNTLSAANTLKTCPAGWAMQRINQDGTFSCLQMAYMNGGLNAKCVRSTDCNATQLLLCDQATMRCVGQSGFACTSDSHCYTGLACTLNGLCSTPPASCTAIKTSYPSAPSGVYLLLVPRQPAAYFYCNMVSADGAGWTLVWSNIRGGTGKPMTQMPLGSAINGIYSWPAANILNGYPSTTANPLESFVMYTGLFHWRGLSPRGKIRYDWSPDYGLGVQQSVECTYTYFTAPSYTLSVSGCVQRVGSVVPGIFTYHNGRPFATVDGGSCGGSYSGTPFWYNSCWDGSIWGGGEWQLDYMNGAYYVASAVSWGTSGSVQGGGNGWLYVS